jgi:hypothetical protein
MRKTLATAREPVEENDAYVIIDARAVILDTPDATSAWPLQPGRGRGLSAQTAVERWQKQQERAPHSGASAEDDDVQSHLYDS